MNCLIIGLVGPMCSGKGEAGKYLETLGFSYQSLSDRVREEALLRGLSLTRENLQNVGNDLRETYGGQILAERTLSKVHSDTDMLVIDGIRNPSEIEFLRKNCDIKIIGIEADRDLRLSWYLERAMSRGEDGVSAEDFYRSDARDSGVGESSLGQQVNVCLLLADHTLVNSGSREQLFADLERLLINQIGVESVLARRGLEK